MVKTAYLDEEDRKILLKTKQKLDEATKLMGELIETIDVLSDSEMMQAIKQGQDDIKAGRVQELRKLLRKSAFAKNSFRIN